MNGSIFFWLLCLIIIFILMATTGCTTRRDEAPRWRGYELQFHEPKTGGL